MNVIAQVGEPLFTALPIFNGSRIDVDIILELLGVKMQKTNNS